MASAASSAGSCIMVSSRQDKRRTSSNMPIRSPLWLDDASCHKAFVSATPSAVGHPAPPSRDPAMHAYANPLRFQRIADAVYPWTAWGAAILAPIGLVLALAIAPADYQQGQAYRIMYIHVPAAWMAMASYLCVAVGSAVGLIWRHPLAEVAARSAAPIGAVFTAIALITGSIWGKPMWGTWWVWDARLTSVLILFFLYLGYMALHDAFEDPARGARAASILALVGVVNLPIIKFSVDWWNTLHQPASIVRMDGPTLAPEMLWPLLTMVLVFHLYFVTVLILRMRAQLTERRLQNLRLSQAAGS
jgi:heme exporter protein C